MSKVTAVLVAMLLCAGIGMGQIATSTHARDGPPSQESLAALLDRISGLPVEYKADLAFAIIHAARPSLTLARKRGLLDDVFHSATSAHYQYMVVEAAGNAAGDTVTHITRNTLAWLKVDALDIQTRAIELALPSTPQFATALFEELNLSEVRASCKDPAVEDVSAFYTTARNIIEDKRIKTVFKQDKALYLQGLASNLRVPAQIAPLANLMIQVSLSPEHMGQVEMALVSSLSTITASDREITAAEEGGNLTHVIELLAAKLTQSSVSSDPLLAAYRGFLLRSLTRERCSDHSLDRAQMARKFNALIATTGPQSSDLRPLSEAQLYPQSTGDAASDQVIPFNQQALAEVRRIVAAHQARVAEQYRLGVPSTIEPETSDVEDVLKYVTSGEPSDAECSVCDFHAKCTLAMMLKDVIPAGDELERAINAEVDYLSFNPMEKDNPVAWLLYFKELINSSRTPNDEATAVLTAETRKGRTPWGLPSPEAAVIRKSLRKSPDPITAAYISADDLLHLPYEPLVPKGSH